MQKILLLGAGRSSSSLIQYLLQNSENDNFQVTVADLSVEAARAKTGNHPRSNAIELDIFNEALRYSVIQNANVVISLLPPALHAIVAADCVKAGVNMVTASYLSPAIAELHEEAVKKGVLLMNECGLDPGIDHMSAMQLIHKLKKVNAEIVSYKSYTGGLVAPEYIDNPWGYKFSWNPKNVILAGQGTAKYIEDNRYRYIPYSRIFSQTDTIYIDGNPYDGYANRDSLAYRKHYELDDIPTLLRGTLRQEGFCKAWNAFVQAGLTDDACIIENSKSMSYAQLLESFLPPSRGIVKERLARLMQWESDSKEMQMLESTGIFTDEKAGLQDATAAAMLQHLLESRWKLMPGDKDMILMQHIFIYKKDNREYRLTSTLSLKGDDQVYTAMAKTVGYPLGIIARLLLQGKISLKGVHLPLSPQVYEPVIMDLETLGISFKETETALT